MTRRLRGVRGRGLAGLATLSLTVALACSVTGVGCSSQSGGFGALDGGTSADTSTGGQDTSTVDTGSGVMDVVSEPAPTAQLGTPTFTPPGPAMVAIGSTTTINPPTNFPADGTLFYSTDGTVPTPKSSLYVGPIQLGADAGAGGMETIIAIAHDPSGALQDSLPGVAVYTFETPDAPTLGAVTFSQPSGSYHNDFLLALSSAGGTVCYTLGGSATTPTCNPSTGACTGTTATYTGTIQIDGEVTGAAAQVTVTAIACEPGSTPSPPLSQTYSLVVADPTMVVGGITVPANTGTSNIPWPSGQGGLAPSIGTLTGDSIVVHDPVVIAYSTTSGALSCSTGLQGPNPTSFNGVTAPRMSANTTYQALGCKQGYFPSNVVTFPLTIELNPPVLASAAKPFNYELDMVGVPGGIGTDITDSANDTAAGTTTPPAGEIICATTDGSPAGCVATSSSAVCTGTGTSTPVVGVTGAVVNVVACAPGLNTSKQNTATYTLQLAPPFLASSEATGGGLGKPGWSWSTSGLPILSMTIPTGAKTTAPNGYPYADGNTWQVNQVQGLPCTGTANAPEPGASYPPPSGCTGPTNFPADYYCWSVTTTPGCGTAGTCSFGTKTAATANATVLPGGASGAGVVAGGTLQIIPCDNDTAGEDVFAPSTATKVTFSHPPRFCPGEEGVVWPEGAGCLAGRSGLSDRKERVV